jgi:hypothetical protein
MKEMTVVVELEDRSGTFNSSTLNRRRLSKSTSSAVNSGASAINPWKCRWVGGCNGGAMLGPEEVLVKGVLFHVLVKGILEVLEL